jgi:hypothetical protein
VRRTCEAKKCLADRCALCSTKTTRIHYWKYPEAAVGNSQKRAIQNYRSRLSERGVSRFEVLGRVIRSIARRLAEGGPEASRLRAAVTQTMAGEPPKKGGILAA